MSNVSISLINKVGTKSEWETANPTIPTGEILLEKPLANARNFNMKIGCGLPYKSTTYAGIFGCGTDLSTWAVNSAFNLNNLTFPGSYYANSDLSLNNEPNWIGDIISGRKMIKVYSNKLDAGDSQILLTQEIRPSFGAYFGYFTRNGSYDGTNWTWNDWKEITTSICHQSYSSGAICESGAMNKVNFSVEVSGHYLITALVNFQNNTNLEGKRALFIQGTNSVYACYADPASQITTVQLSKYSDVEAGTDYEHGQGFYIIPYQTSGENINYSYIIQYQRMGPRMAIPTL